MSPGNGSAPETSVSASALSLTSPSHVDQQSPSLHCIVGSQPPLLLCTPVSDASLKAPKDCSANRSCFPTARRSRREHSRPQRRQGWPPEKAQAQAKRARPVTQHRPQARFHCCFLEEVNAVDVAHARARTRAIPRIRTRAALGDFHS